MLLRRLASALLLAGGGLRAQTPATANLTVVNASLQTQEDGAAVEAGHVFRSGEYAYGSFFVTGFARKPVAEAGSEDTLVSLSYEVKVVDPEGIPVQAAQSGTVSDTVRKEDRRTGNEWRPKIRFLLTLPPAPPSGEYHADIRVKDEYAGKEVSYRLPFQVKGYDAPKVSELTVANFRFQRTDRASERPLTDAVYHVNDFVWVRFDVAGFQLGPMNKYDVALGLAVLDAAGKVLFENPEATELTESPEYPKRALPGALSVQVAPGTGKAEYQFRVTATDRVGGKTTQQTGKFQVE